MTKKLLELFSGTHSIGKVLHNKGYEVYSLDRDLGGTNGDYTSTNHFKVDILTWDYKQFPKGYFDLITASPVCATWSAMRRTWIGRISKTLRPQGGKVTKQDLEDRINEDGKPMVDKIFEIINYFEPDNWWIENPQTGSMKFYIESEYPEFNTYYDFDYCKYTNWGYQKKTRFWTNIEDITPLKCKKDCDNMIVGTKVHKTRIGISKVIRERNEKLGMNMNQNMIERYRIPEKIIEVLVKNKSY